MRNNTLPVNVFIGRFQGLHTGHVTTIREALKNARLILIIGSAFGARTPRNPFTLEERKQHIMSVLSRAEQQRLTVVGIRDYYHPELWAKAVRKAVSWHTETPCLVGLDKDESTYYYGLFPDWSRKPSVAVGQSSGTEVRSALFEKRPLPFAVPSIVRGWLEQWQATDTCRELAEEWAYYKGYKDTWACAPFPPVFMTGDAVIEYDRKLCLVRRKNLPGRGLLALPGGFLEPHESLEACARREVFEETGLRLSTPSLADAVFDHPARSLRGRVITRSFQFILDEKPEYAASTEEATEVVWVPISLLPSLEDQFFEDHYSILRHFEYLSSY